MSDPTHAARLFLEHLAGTVELAAARSVLREIFTLADQSPGLSNEQLRFRLLAVAAYAELRSTAAPQISDQQPVPGLASGDRSASIQLPPRPRLATGRTEDFRFLVASRFHRPPMPISQKASRG
ncbi:MAG: hypothetical protein ACRDRX_18100 [Pseudonocardiaceae bacterium]